jgi:uncharacterized protein (TIGR03382 family)
MERACSSAKSSSGQTFSSEAQSFFALVTGRSHRCHRAVFSPLRFGHDEVDAELPVGEYQVAAQATDAAGNTGPKTTAVALIVRRVNQAWGGGGIGGGNGCSSVSGPALLGLLLLLSRRRRVL